MTATDEASLARQRLAAYIDDAALIGAGSTVAPGAVVHGRCQIGRNCRIDPGAVLDAGTSDDTIIIGDDVHVMASATITSGASIGQGAVVQPGTVVTRTVPPHAIVAGNPAQIVGYTTASNVAISATLSTPSRTAGVSGTRVRNVTLHQLPKIIDLRGNLTVGEANKSVPFDIQRYFMVFGVPNAEVRGEHAHRRCHQFLVCAHGSCHVVADDGTTREEFILDDPSLGLHLPPLTWGVQYKYSPDAVLVVFASELYDAEEYIRDYSEFLELTGQEAT